MEELNKDEPTIAKLLVGMLPRLKTTEKELDEHEALNPYKNIHPLVEKATYIGLECEIENVNLSRRSPYWTITKDGSLRNGGLEFVSHPIKVTRVEQALHELFNSYLYPGFTYSDRTSVHIHMNVRTLTVSQLQTLVLTYMVFEKALFKWVGNDRDKNIYCVPLYDIVLTEGLVTNLENIRGFGWMKYTALNLRPILDKGSIEFRHLYGTNDTKTIITWINFLLCLKKYALRNKPEYIKERIYELNTTSEYMAFLREVFDDQADHLVYPELLKDMSSCITNIKGQCFFNYEEVRNTKLTDFLVKNKHIINTVAPKNVKIKTRTIGQIMEDRVQNLENWLTNGNPPVGAIAQGDF